MRGGGGRCYWFRSRSGPVSTGTVIAQPKASGEPWPGSASPTCSTGCSSRELERPVVVVSCTYGKGGRSGNARECYSALRDCGARLDGTCFSLGDNAARGNGRCRV